MNSKSTKRVSLPLKTLALLSIIVSITACDSFDSLSDVDEQVPVPPVAKVTVVGSTTNVRAGTEVLVSGKDSFGLDGPILGYAWQQSDSSGIPLELVVRNANTVSFTAPDVAAPTMVSLQLTVTDAGQKTATDSVSMTVQPFEDSNRFLLPLLVPQSFSVVAATATVTPGLAGAPDLPFEVSVQPVVTYPGRDGLTKTWQGPVTKRSGVWSGATGTGGPVPTAFNNPKIVFELPSLDTDDINMTLLSAAPGAPERDSILDLQRVDQAVMNILVTLTAPDNQADAHLIVTTREGATLLEQSNDGSGTPTTLSLPLQTVLSASGKQSAASAQAYYNAIDPAGERATFTNWLTINCFDASAADYGADAHAVYTNDFDLGFGRDMFVKAGCGGADNLASVVINYPSLEAAAKKIDPIIAVAMEYTPPVDGSSTVPFTKFYIYTPDDTGEYVRVLSANFDGRGEKYLPGSCTACHGGEIQPLDANGAYPNGGNLQSNFMPWDLDSFLYTDTDPAFSNTAVNDNLRALYTRSAQEAEFKALNRFILGTFAPEWPIYELVEGWYGGPGLPASTFDGSFTPPGWIPESSGGPVGNPDDSESLYHDVMAQNCRACHTQRDEQTTPVFSNYAQFIDQADVHILRIYNEGSMPLARRTMDQFWVSNTSPSPAEILRNHLGVDASVTPGQPVAAISGFEMQSSVNLMPFSVDGSDSSFAAGYSWSFLSRPAGSSTQFVGADKAQSGFFIDQSGAYEIQLEVTSIHGQTDTATFQLLASSVVPIAGNNTSLDVAEGGGANLNSSLLSYNDPDNLPAELVYTITTPPVRGTLSQSTFTQEDLDNASISYTHDGSETTGDSFFFSLSDGNETLTGQQFSLVVIPGNDAPTPVINDPITVTEGGGSVISGSQLAFADVDNMPVDLTYTVTTPPVNGALSVSTFTQQDLNAAALVSYTHDGSETSADSFVVTLSDGGISVPGVTVSITVTPVNNEPAITTNAGLTLMEGTSSVIAQARLESQDTDNTAAELMYTVTTLPVNGILSTTAFSQKTINDGLLSYTHDGTETSSDSFAFEVRDGGTAFASGTFTITVVPVSDAPTLMSNIDLTVHINEREVEITTANLSYDDVDNDASELIYTVETSPSEGTLSPATGFSQAQIDGGLVKYSHSGDHTSPASVSFTYAVSDGDNTSSGSFTINIRASYDVNVHPLWQKDRAAKTCSSAGCHDSTSEIVVGAFSRPGFLGSQTQVYSQLVPERTDFPSDRNNDGAVNVMDAYILCVSINTCNGSNGAAHTGGDALGGVTAADYLMIKRWIEEGLDAPGNGP